MCPWGLTCRFLVMASEEAGLKCCYLLLVSLLRGWEVSLQTWKKKMMWLLRWRHLQSHMDQKNVEFRPSMLQWCVLIFFAHLLPAG